MEQTKQELFERLKKIIFSCAFVDEEITEESTFDDLGIGDSLDFVEVIMECEKEFSITIADESVEKMENVGQLLDLIYETVSVTA